VARPRQHPSFTLTLAPASIPCARRHPQQQLVSEGESLRVLISYGEYWFPWYMRRLAERPANVWFVVKNLFS
jgi:proline dehydrogenase